MTKIYKNMDVTPSGKMVFEIDYDSLEKNEHWVKLIEQYKKLMKEDVEHGE